MSGSIGMSLNFSCKLGLEEARLMWQGLSLDEQEDLVHIFIERPWCFSESGIARPDFFIHRKDPTRELLWHAITSEWQVYTGDLDSGHEVLANKLPCLNAEIAGLISGSIDIMRQWIMNHTGCFTFFRKPCHMLKITFEPLPEVNDWIRPEAVPLK